MGRSLPASSGFCNVRPLPGRFLGSISPLYCWAEVLENLNGALNRGFTELQLLCARPGLPSLLGGLSSLLCLPGIFRPSSSDHGDPTVVSSPALFAGARSFWAFWTSSAPFRLSQISSGCHVFETRADPRGWPQPLAPCPSPRPLASRSSPHTRLLLATRSALCWWLGGLSPLRLLLPGIFGPSPSDHGGSIHPWHSP